MVSQGVGRKTHKAAGSPGLARAATKKRSGTNSEVRAPEIVGMCAVRWYASPLSSNTSTYPSPQLRYRLALLIDEEIVGVTAGIDGRNCAAVAHGEDAKLSGIPKRYKNSFGLFVQ